MISVGKTIYIFTENTYLHCDNCSIMISLPDGKKQCVPYGVVSEIIIFVNVSLTFYFVDMCSHNDIIIHCLSPYGKYLGQYLGAKTGNVLLRRNQFLMLSSDKSVEYVRNLIGCKLFNSVGFLKYVNYRRKSDNISFVIDFIKKQIVQLRTKSSIDEMRQLEGICAAKYFSVFDDIIVVNDNDMTFVNRSKHPPLNRCNALLSLFYTLMTSVCASALFTRGLDVECGYLHTLRSGRNSLACDLVEEFRACIVDKFVINLINRNEVKSCDFDVDAGGIKLNSDAYRRLMVKWDEYLDTTYVIHKLYDKKLSLRLLAYEQALLLGQYIRGDIDVYPPFLMEY